MISNKDKMTLGMATSDFIREIDKNFLGDDFRPQFKLSITFLPSGSDDVQKELSRCYDVDMLRMRSGL
jgi:hypothetical protein